MQDFEDRDYSLNCGHEVSSKSSSSQCRKKIMRKIDSKWLATHGRVPIVLGVTGHRTVQGDHENLIGLVKRECQRLAKKYQYSPFLVVSALAEGADRLVTKVAMEELNAALIAVLPLPRLEYEKDFQSQVSREEFAKFLSEAESVIEAPLLTKDNSLVEAGEARDWQYAWAGAFVAEHCQILFALWDGKKSRGMGGTAEIVALFEQGYASKSLSAYSGEISPLDPPEPGLLIYINTAKRTVRREHSPFEAMRGSNIRTILKRTERYNQDVNKYHKKINKNRPLSEEAAKGGTIAPTIAMTYQASDALAILFATYVRSADLVMYLFAFLAFVLFNFLDAAPIFSTAYLSIAALMAILAGYIRVPSIYIRFLEYRGLAEAMRVLYFWRAAGIGRSIWLCYLSKHSGVIHWVRQAVRAVEFRHDAMHHIPDEPPDSPDNRVDFVKREWIEAQIDYYQNSRSLHEWRSKRWIWLSRISITFSFALAMALAWLAVAYGESLWQWRDTALPAIQGGLSIHALVKGLQVLLGISAAVGLLARGYLLRLADFEHAKQFSGALQIFEIAKNKLEGDLQKPGDWTKRDILEQLGREALLENAEWLWVRHSRPFDVPQ